MEGDVREVVVSDIALDALGELRHGLESQDLGVGVSQFRKEEEHADVRADVHHERFGAEIRVTVTVEGKDLAVKEIRVDRAGGVDR